MANLLIKSIGKVVFDNIKIGLLFGDRLQGLPYFVSGTKDEGNPVTTE